MSSFDLHVDLHFCGFLWYFMSIFNTYAMKFLKRKKPEIVDISTKSRLFSLAGAEGLGLACRLGRCFCTSCRGLHRRPAPLDTLRVPSVQIIQSEPKQKDTRRCLFVLAGAEGLEPSARGFGDRCSTNWAIPLYLWSAEDRRFLVGHQGLEPRTIRLWAECSNQLS